MERIHSLTSFSDDDLLRRLSDLLGQSRRNEADLVAHIGEVDRRRLYAREASPSMFAYCTELLHLSEAEAYLRIAAARAAREHPLLLTLLADGRLHLTAIAKLAPHLTPENREALLSRAADRSKREIEELVAELAPRPDAPAVMRKLPDRRAGTTSPALRISPDAAAPSLGLRPEGGASVDPQLRPDGVGAREPELRLDAVEAAGVQWWPPGAAVVPAVPRARPAVVEPLAPARYKVQFTASAELHDKLERLRALMRPSVPDGDLAAIVEQAVTEKLQRLEARRFARTQAPRKTLSQSRTSLTTRQIPAAVKRAVWERDGGRCRYVDEQGRRCTARQGLEYHHRRPFGHGGDHSVANVALGIMQMPQRLPGRGRLRPEDHGSASPLGDPSPGADAPSVAVTTVGRAGVGRTVGFSPGHDRESRSPRATTCLPGAAHADSSEPARGDAVSEPLPAGRAHPAGITGNERTGVAHPQRVSSYRAHAAGPRRRG